MKITVIGGGVVGLASAYYLVKSGHDVTVMDSGTCGKGASEGNAGWIVPALSQPFNSPGAISGAMRSLLKKDSRIRFGMIPHPEFLKWVLMFARNSSEANAARAREAIVALNAQTAELFDDLFDDTGGEHRNGGLVMPYRTPEAMESFQKSHAQVVEAGYQGRLVELSAADLRSLEPDLNPDMVGGYHLVDERSVRPESMTGALVDWLREAGAEIMEHQKVNRLQKTRGHFRIETTGGTHTSDQVVVAAGVNSAAILKTAGYRLPLQAGRGVSITTRNGPHLNHAVKIDEISVACTPFEDGTRFSGTFDFVSQPRIAVERRMSSVLNLASRYFPTLEPVKAHMPAVWSGMRPCTPDSVPYIGTVPGDKGLLVATGHGTLGVTLAPVTGQAIADLVNGEPIPDHIRACALDRPQVKLV